MRKRMSKGLRAFADRVERHHKKPEEPPVSAEHWSFTVVVNGVPVKVRLSRHQKIADLMRSALKQGGIPPIGRPGHAGISDIAFWELRDADGKLLANSSSAEQGRGAAKRIGEAGLEDGDTLFLGPEAGGGGSCDLTEAAAALG